ncbi:alpha-ketoglutarate-dependent dioxygenase AlkB [Rhodobacteraceae bacterium CCMM004]|nr:alpha-ketoglutarate-dependent dioxygenase AlkB [Rhodobacteraceae bacterium CCMM004]
MDRADPDLVVRGVGIWRGLVPPAAQSALVADLRAVAEAAPFLRPVTRRGQALSVRMTSAGALGWITDRRGYRYEPRHPSGAAWPPIPDRLLRLWAAVVPDAPPPDSCLVNFYDAAARMGLHQDCDEADLTQPVVSLSLGDDALFRLGSVARGGRTESLWLHSGDVAVLAGAARLIHHGIDRIRGGSSSLLPEGGRINVTLRVAGPPR